MVSLNLAGCFSQVSLKMVIERLRDYFRSAFRPQRRLALLLSCALVAGSLAASAAPQHRVPVHPHRGDHILLRPKPGIGPDALARFHTSQRNRVVREFKHLDGLEVVSVPAGKSVEEALEQYQLSGLVEYAEPDYLVQAALAPNDPLFSNGTLWGLNNPGQSPGVSGADIKAPQAWDTQTSASGIIVAVIDSGVRYTHEDLAANMWVNPYDGSHGFNALTGSNNPMDDSGHGTLVAGIIGGAGNNGTGISGVAWRVQLMACKFLDAAGNGFVSDAIECIDYARTNGAQIINASWGSPANSAALVDAIASAGRAGVVFVAAAGNNGINIEAAPFYPASFDLDNIVVVAATTQADGLAGFSNYGNQSVDLAAPGCAIYSTSHSGDSAYTYGSGTSFAAPFVSGAFALMRAVNPALSCKDVVARLLAGTDPLAGLSGKCVTGGRLNLAHALCPPVLANFTTTPTTGAVPLTVNFTDTSRGTIVWRAWNFGDGVTLTNVFNPTQVFTNEGTYTVTLTVVSDEGVTNRASQTVNAVANYSIQAAAFQWLNTDLMFPLALGSDGVSAAINLPFPFYFYGKCYYQISVGANGVISFGAKTQPPALRTDLPDTNAPAAMLCPFWTDRAAVTANGVWMAVRGKPPLRRVVISWSVPADGGAGTLGFQAALFESSQRILFQYLSPVEGPLALATSQSATVGVEHESGLIAAKYSANAVSSLTNQQAMVFVPATKTGVTNYPAATVTALPLAAAGQFQFQLHGQSASTYVIEASTDLKQWETVGSGTTDLDGVISFVDLQSVGLPQRFYRAGFGL